ncbi:hemerythrin domain-containing protein [Brucella anthropi]|uniref:hemerythrin domain-containing protein n=1 Tax=Brucella anthropi TaxID=529 RepID=UPI0007751DAC|nr:hemerythrin domain-containing protein [Brucella anthropi]KXO77869.1 calcium-binding protein [Brucella anthropi]
MDTPPVLHATDISRLEAHHHDLLELCLQLEEIADDLETGASMQEYRRIAMLIPRLVGETHALEEDVLFPDFSRQAHSHFATAIIERLKAEHRCDRLAAEELSQTLMAIAEGRCSLACDTISYMVRGFMESVRRHILSEKLMIEALLAAKSEEREVFG